MGSFEVLGHDVELREATSFYEGGNGNDYRVGSGTSLLFKASCKYGKAFARTPDAALLSIEELISKNR